MNIEKLEQVVIILLSDNLEGYDFKVLRDNIKVGI